MLSNDETMNTSSPAPATAAPRFCNRCRNSPGGMCGMISVPWEDQSSDVLCDGRHRSNGIVHPPPEAEEPDEDQFQKIPHAEAVQDRVEVVRHHAVVGVFRVPMMAGVM